MGASNFQDEGRGKTPEEVFQNLKHMAWCDCDEDDEGYSGTILEKQGFVMLTKPKGKNIQAFINEQSGKNDKWGPAFCVEEEMEDGPSKFYFFGMSPS